MIFCAYENWERDWNEEEVDLAERLELLSFSETEVLAYLEKLYESDEIDFRSKITKPSFIRSARAILPAELYSSAAGSNVPVIASELKVWYRKTKADLKL